MHFIKTFSSNIWHICFLNNNVPCNFFVIKKNIESEEIASNVLLFQWHLQVTMRQKTYFVLRNKNLVIAYIKKILKIEQQLTGWYFIWKVWKLQVLETCLFKRETITNALFFDLTFTENLVAMAIPYALWST